MSTKEQLDGRIIRCEATGCKSATTYNSPKWRDDWLRVWVQEDTYGVSLCACSNDCAKTIKSGFYNILNDQPKVSSDQMKAQQMKLF